MISGIFGTQNIDNMKKILILGGTGMLGWGVVKSFLESEGFETWVTGRGSTLKKISENEELVDEYKKLSGGTLAYDAHAKDLNEVFQLMGGKPEYIINCIGIIKPFIDKDPFSSAYVNGAFPHFLARWGEQLNIKIIHITTDCVFNGAKGHYKETDSHDELDFYGRSKSLGEPDNCMVLRTSIVGPEINGPSSLLGWVQSQKDKEVLGYTNHFWNGVTTKEYGQVCQKIINEDLYENKKYHIFNPTPLSKMKMIEMFSEKYNLNITVKPTKAASPCNRTLSTDHDFSKKLKIKPFRLQLQEL